MKCVSHRDETYSIRNIVDVIVIALYGGRWSATLVTIA